MSIHRCFLHYKEVLYAGESECIDAIGVIEGEAESLNDENNIWSRKVSWNVLEGKQNVRDINGGTVAVTRITKMIIWLISQLIKQSPKTTIKLGEKY